MNNHNKKSSNIKNAKSGKLEKEKNVWFFFLKKINFQIKKPQTNIRRKNYKENNLLFCVKNAKINLIILLKYFSLLLGYISIHIQTHTVRNTILGFIFTYFFIGSFFFLLMFVYLYICIAEGNNIISSKYTTHTSLTSVYIYRYLRLLQCYLCCHVFVHFTPVFISIIFLRFFFCVI